MYPNCTEHGFIVSDSVITSKIRVFHYLDDGALIDPHNDSCELHDEKCANLAKQNEAYRFRVNSTDACGLICFRSGVCDWWMSESVGINHTMCSLYHTHGELSINGHRDPLRMNTTTTGHKSCTLSNWPVCVEQQSLIMNSGYAELWLNASMVLGSPTSSPLCHEGNCGLTDKFPSHSIEECASVCSRIWHCNHWSFGGGICYLRTTRVKTQIIGGYVSGDRACARGSPWIPPRHPLWTLVDN
jgi:hypothetical protein